MLLCVCLDTLFFRQLSAEGDKQEDKGDVRREGLSDARTRRAAEGRGDDHSPHPRQLLAPLPRACPPRAAGRRCCPRAALLPPGGSHRGPLGGALPGALRDRSAQAGWGAAKALGRCWAYITGSARTPSAGARRQLCRCFSALPGAFFPGSRSRGSRPGRGNRELCVAGPQPQRG